MHIDRGAGAIFGLIALAACSPEPSTSETAPAAKPEVRIDRHDGRVAQGTPLTEGASGVLGYMEECLFLTEQTGNRIGLVLPEDAQFDGKVLRRSATTPEGASLDARVGEYVGLSGALVENGAELGYSCDTADVLLVPTL